MRDDQVIAVIRRECAHSENVSVLGDQQLRMGVESLLDIMSERGTLIRAFFSPAHFRERFNEVYSAKAKAFNEKMEATMAREKLRI